MLASGDLGSHRYCSGAMRYSAGGHQAPRRAQKIQTNHCDLSPRKHPHVVFAMPLMYTDEKLWSCQLEICRAYLDGGWELQPLTGSPMHQTKNNVQWTRQIRRETPRVNIIARTSVEFCFTKLLSADQRDCSLMCSGSFHTNVVLSLPCRQH